MSRHTAELKHELRVMLARGGSIITCRLPRHTGGAGASFNVASNARGGGLTNRQHRGFWLRCPSQCGGAWSDRYRHAEQVYGQDERKAGLIGGSAAQRLANPRDRRVIVSSHLTRRLS